MNIGSIHHKKGGSGGKRKKLISQVKHWFLFYANTWNFSLFFKWGPERKEKSFIFNFFMLVSDSETIETLLFMYL